MGLKKFNNFPGRGTFSHGIHPPDNKNFSAENSIEVMPSPDKVVLPLLQSIGAPCEPVVKPKQKVEFGEMVGKGMGFVSASLHTPISGQVQKMSVTTLPSGRHLPSITIKAEGDQVSGRELFDDIIGGIWPKENIRDYFTDTISKAISDAGVVGLGGAAFPTHVKVMPSDKIVIDTLIINGCECEPYLTTDYRLMVEAPDAIITGALLAGYAVSAKEIIIGVEDNKPEAIKILQEKSKGTDIRVAALQTKYPQGSEKQLIQALLNREVPLGGLPGDVGTAMSNVGTIAAIARGVVREKPLTHRVISVTGPGIVNPKNLLVPIGVSIGEVFDFCGGLTKDAARLISGGPMMGFAFSDLNTPVTKGTSGITVLTHDDLKREHETNCVRCGRCVDVCPMNLVPTRLAMAARYKNVELAQKYNIMGCFECGCCTFICPANLKLVQLIRTGKAQVAASQKK